jgi:hypothetical protein
VQKAAPANQGLLGEKIMKQLRYSPLVFVGTLLLCSLLSAQQAAVSTSAAAIVPRLVNFSGKAIDQGEVLTGVTGITFAIYSEETGGTPLWLESRNVQADSKGNYTAQLGVTKSEGLVEHSVMRARLPQAMKEMKAARAARLAPVAHNLLETASAPVKP